MIASCGCGFHPLRKNNARKLVAIVEQLLRARLVAYDAVQTALSEASRFAGLQGARESSVIQAGRALAGKD